MSGRQPAGRTAGRRRGAGGGARVSDDLLADLQADLGADLAIRSATSVEQPEPGVASDAQAAALPPAAARTGGPAEAGRSEGTPALEVRLTPLRWSRPRVERGGGLVLALGPWRVRLTRT